MSMNGNSRASDSPSRSRLGQVIVLIHRRDLLRWRHRRFTFQTRRPSVRIVLMRGSSSVLIVSPLVVGLVRLMVVVSIVAAVRIVRSIAVWVVGSSVLVPAIPFAELVTVLLLLLRGTAVVVPSVRIMVLCVLLVRHRNWGLAKVGNKEERVRRRRGRGGKIVAPGNCGLPADRRGGGRSTWSARDRLVLLAQRKPTWVKMPNFLFSQVTVRRVQWRL